MVRKFSLLGSLFTWFIIISLPFAFGVIKIDKAYVILFVIMTAILFRDYMIIMDDDKISLYSLYRRKNSFLWNTIKKIEVEKKDLGKLLGRNVIILRFYTDRKKYSFNIDVLNKEKIIKQLINYCAHKHIPIIDLAGKDKKQF